MRFDFHKLADMISLSLPQTLVFGEGSVAAAVGRLAERGCRRTFIVTSRPLMPLVQPFCRDINEAGCQFCVWDGANREPTISDFQRVLEEARDFRADAVVGLGGGSALDLAKLVAALYDGQQDIRDVFGIGRLKQRSLFLVCLPTTAGTGSEVSPNAILSDEEEQLKKGVVSPHLVPDVTCVDPLLMRTMPPAVTASTGLDALTHCIEAYANRFSHPVADLFALEGVRLIAGSLRRAYDNGEDREARANMGLGSLYGGLCLGPVNTGAVHALAYPLGGEFHVPHGVANAMLLPHVLAFNIPAAPERYAQIAVAMGAPDAGRALETAGRLPLLVGDLLRHCSVAPSLSALGVPESALGRMAGAAMKVTRLLERNVRSVTEQDALDVYRKAFN